MGAVFELRARVLESTLHHDSIYKYIILWNFLARNANLQVEERDSVQTAVILNYLYCKIT